MQDPTHTRHCTFTPNPHLIDEVLLDHTGHSHPHLLRRTKIQHRELASLSLLASHTRTQFGYHNSHPACLLSFRFQFLGNSHAQRFSKADIRISFNHPAVKVADFGPKHLKSQGTEGQRNWWYNATLSANAGAGMSLPVGPSIGAGAGGSHGKHSAASVEGADLGTEAAVVKWWLREDEQAQDGVPFDFDCAVIVTYTDSFEAMVEVKAGPVFDWLASPWPSSNPVRVQRGLDYGEPIRAVPAVDFATLTAEEWRRLVTPELEFGQDLHKGSR